MADNKKNKGLGLQETKGSFQIRGIVRGTEKDSFIKDIKTRTNKPMRIVNFGVEMEKDKTVYITLNGMERDKVYFSKREGKGKDAKTVTEAISWAERLKFKKDGFRPIGVNLGLTKVVNEQGVEVNDKKSMFEFDACKYIADNLKDDMSVFIKGKTEFSTYNDKHQTKFVPNQISLCKPVDFEAEDYTAIGNFEQTIVFTGINKNDNGDFTVSAKIVTYNSIEDAEFTVKSDRPALAKNLRKLKPYTSIKVYGNIEVEHEVSEVEEDDGWGEPNPMDRVNNPTIRSLVITGADKDSIDTELYSEEEMESAIAKLKSDKKADSDYGDNDDDGWGDGISDLTATDEDDEWD